MLKFVTAFLTRFKRKSRPTYTPPAQPNLTQEQLEERERQRKRMEEFRKQSPFTYK